MAWALTMAVLTGCADAPSAEWSRFRGPEGTGTVPAATHAGTLPVVWSEGSPNIRWKTVVPGVGNSSPVVGGGLVFLTYTVRADGDDEQDETDDGRDRTGSESVTRGDQRWRGAAAFDLESGEMAWDRRLFQATAERQHHLTTLAAPSAVTDGEAVWVYFGSHLFKLGLDGEVLWDRVVDPKYAELSRYAAASSPVLAGDAVILFQDREWAKTPDVGWLAAFDRETGEELWRESWDDTCCAYSTPLVVDRGDGLELLLAMSGAVVAYDAESGERLWIAPVRLNQMVGSPVLADDLLLVSGGANNVRNNAGFRLSGAGAATEVEKLWEDPRLAPQNASPVLANGVYFTVTDPGVVTARDPLTGAIHWQHRLQQGRNRASLIAGDGKVYVSSAGGRVTVLAAAPELQILSENQLDAPGTNATPAVGGGCLLLRTKQHLYCVEPGEAPQT